MKRALGVLFALAAVSRAATLVSSFREGNTIFLRLSDGAAQVEWVSESSFRFTRRWDGNFVRRPALNLKPVVVSLSDTTESLLLSAKYVTLKISKNGVLLHTSESNGAVIMSDASEAERQDGVISWERMAPARARYFGLGARDDPRVELRGSRIAALKPFLLSSLGYGELHVAPGDYTFDLARAKPDRYRIEAHGASAIDYYFFFGPAPKEIFEQLLLVEGPIAPLDRTKFGLLRREELPAGTTVFKKPHLADTIHSLINASLSGVILTALSLGDTPVPPSKRAIQLGSVAALVTGVNPSWMVGSIRGELDAYLATYAEEARERGLPLLRPLPMQYSKDPEAAKVGDQFMLGDELLVAPMPESGITRSVYLPMGIWTKLSDNAIYDGRRTVGITALAGELPIFSRNGAIVPLGEHPMELHYFPRLGGEFFLFESDLGEYSQVHAGPAGDYMRLEIESKKDRDYEWVVHHSERPKKVVAGGDAYAQVASRDRLRARAWYYDVRSKNLHVRAMGPRRRWYHISF